MPTTPLPSYLLTRRDWKSALSAVRKLMNNGSDTVQVFRIMRALNAGSAKRSYIRLADTVEGGRIAFSAEELAERLADKSYLATFAEGTVGGAYCQWLIDTGHTAEGLAELSLSERNEAEYSHPYAWTTRRTRDVHDLWHVLTGYKADEDFGEICLVAFSYAQTGALGWAFIAAMSSLKSFGKPFGRAYVRAVWEAYRLGKTANWLLGENYHNLLNEPLEAARMRLQIGKPTRYFTAQEAVNRG